MNKRLHKKVNILFPINVKKVSSSLPESLSFSYLEQKIKSELHLEKSGLRYSWGFPSCPDVSQHHLLWKLLEPEKSGMTLTESGQIIPEQSTAAIVIHHPDAKYFVI